eukprot:773798_1
MPFIRIDKKSIAKCATHSDHASSNRSIATQPPHVTIVRPKLLNESIKIDESKKPFIGGYIDKRTKRQYHNAQVQYPLKLNHKKSKLFCRQTQTIKTKNFQQQTSHDCHTQMDRSDLLLDHSKDICIDDRKRIFDPNDYVDAKQLKLIQIESAIKIQCAIRMHLAKNRLSEMKTAKHLKMQDKLEKLKQRQMELERRQKVLKYKQNNPQHSYEFKHIINTMTQWNSKQLSKLLQNPKIPAKTKHKTKSKMIRQHNKELRNIQQRQLNTQKKHTKLRKQNLLKEMMSPKTWIMSDGRPVSVRTPTTHRAEQLIFIYNALRDKTMSTKHRLSLLTTLKRVIETEIEINTMEIYNDIKDIGQLIQRERDMIDRKRPKRSLRGLRTRLINKYFNLLLIPQFNPEAARFSSTPRYVSPRVKPKLVSKSYNKHKHIRRTHALTPNTKTFVQFGAYTFP